MDGFQMLIFILGILFGAFTFFLPAVIAKKLIIDRVAITLNVKVITMVLLGAVTLIIAGILAYTINGGIPSTNKWALWMLIDYYYLFHSKRKKKDNINPQLYTDIEEYEESQKVGSSQTDSNVKSIEPSDSQGKGKKKVKVTKYDELYKEMDEFEERARLTKEDPASTTEEAPCVEIPSAPITPLEEIHLEENPTEQPTNDRASLLSQLGNLSEDELKAVVKLASALSSIKEDKQKD